MTIFKLLAQEKHGDITVEAWEAQDKDSRTPRYEITISKDSVGLLTEIVGKTTWKKHFKETADMWR